MSTIKVWIKRDDVSDYLKLKVVKSWLDSDQVSQWRRKIMKKNISQGKLNPLDCFAEMPEEYVAAELQNFFNSLYGVPKPHV